jgi:ankyrin repeat protein
MRFAFFSLCSVLSFLLTADVSSAQKGSDKRPPVNIPALIDRLVEVAESDVGYSATVTGHSFLPLDREGHFQTGMLFQKPSVPSETVREIVKQGAVAAPHLIAHLGDQRATKITTKHEFGGFGGMFYEDMADYNPRTTKPPAAPVRPEEEEDGLDRLFGRSARQAHTLTVGDLCFVALGQIVNRHFNAVRYQPTAIIIVSSPTHSPDLLSAVTKQWDALTPKRHRASLVADFLKPDFEERRIGACKRLAYYYPDALEPLALQVLAQPTYDVFDVESFVRKTLYRTKDARKRRQLFEAYLAKKGSPSRDGILEQLFGDLETLEAHEEHRLSPPLTEFGAQPRELLIELYGYKPNVRSVQRPRFTDSLAATEKARLIADGLIYDSSAKIDRAVRDLLASTEQDDYLALACMQRLVGRGYDTDIEKYCRRRIPQAEKSDREQLQNMLDRLGWNQVHVTVDRHDRDGLRDLIAGGADLWAKGRNGMTPLHLAAVSGDMESLQLLVVAKVDVDPKNALGETPVQLAARADHPEAVRFLVGRGCAVPDILTAAIVGRRDRAAALLLQDVAQVHAATAYKRTALHLASWWGHTPVAELLIDKGASVNAEDEDGWMPLHVAIARRHESIARVLLAHKANVNAHLPHSGPQPLHLAVHAGDAKLVKRLLEHKADVNAKAGEGFVSPLHITAAEGQAGIAEMLLEAGAAIEARDEKGRTPLHVAAEMGQGEVARILLKHKADPTAYVGGKDEMHTGYQPLHLAAAKGQTAVLEVLLAHKAALHAGTKPHGQKPLDLAAENGHIEAARCLLKHGADVNERSASQCTPLYFAAQDGQTDMGPIPARQQGGDSGCLRRSPRPSRNCRLRRPSRRGADLAGSKAEYQRTRKTGGADVRSVSR